VIAVDTTQNAETVVGTATCRETVRGHADFALVEAEARVAEVAVVAAAAEVAVVAAAVVAAVVAAEAAVVAQFHKENADNQVCQCILTLPVIL